MNLKEFGFNSIIAGAGLLVTNWLGGWDAALKALIVFMILDYATGFLSAWKNKQVDSEVMFWGGIRKGAVLAVVAVAVMMDQMVGNKGPIFRTLAVYFYVAREGLSITENLGLLGVPLPGFVTKVLTQLQEKGEAK
jgi:toxin secretion/phage lysis holin